ncbi:MAG: bifunctional DNA primase/polymerase [Polyangia bacterium]
MTATAAGAPGTTAAAGADARCLAAALALTAHGLRVLLLHAVHDDLCTCGDPSCKHPGKHPRFTGGWKTATTDEATIRRWFAQYPDSNIGIATGAVNGLVILDIDPRHGGDESLRRLCAEYGLTLDTPAVRTGGDGAHYYFKHPGGSITSRVGLYLGVDIRADGGYVVAPPSLHKSGKRYEWEPGSGLDDVPPALVPGWLLEKLAEPPWSRRQTADTGGPIHAGQRNSTLISLAGSMRKRGMSAEEMLPSLLAVSAGRCTPPLDEDEVQKIAQSAARYEPWAAAAGAVVVTMADVKAERVRYLWSGRVPLAKLTLFVGDPGIGKSTVAVDLAARVSVGTEMPHADGEAAAVNAPAAVVLLTAEDGLADTVRPRLEAAGADLRMVHVIKSVRLTGGQEAAPSLPRDSEQIEKIVAEKAAKLLVIDPLMAFLGSKIDSWKDQSVRAALAPLAALAERTGAAVVAIAHLNKKIGASALQRSGGSIGLVAAARSVLLFGHGPNDSAGGRRVVAPAKGNLSRFACSLAYTIEEAPPSGAGRIRWQGRSQHTADGLLAPRLQEHSVLAAAMDALRVLLASGEMPAKQAMGAMQKCGFAESTIKRAKKTLRVGERKDGHGAWYWSLQVDPLDPLAHQGGQEPPENTEEDQGDQGDQGDQDSHMGQGDQHSQTPLAAFDYVPLPAECYRAQSFGRLNRARGQT